MSSVRLVGQESNYRFWPIWLVIWAGIILVLIQGLNIFVLYVIQQDTVLYIHQYFKHTFNF